MHMARRAAAWAQWTCNIRPLQAKPASAGYNQRERASARSLFLGAPGRAHLLGGESPLHSRHGQVLAEGNGFSGDRESEGSWKQSAGATNRKRIEASQWGKQAQICEAQYMYGTP